MKRTGRTLPRIVMHAFAVAMLHGCATVPLPMVDAVVTAMAHARDVPIDQVAHGRCLMVTSCVACHQPIQPSSLTFVAWQRALPRMLEKSDLTSEDGRDIRAYVLVVQEVERQARP
ncbi:MAG: hypothetical protein ABIP94_08810 [Planctomycetota bacterium]